MSLSGRGAGSPVLRRMRPPEPGRPGSGLGAPGGRGCGAAPEGRTHSSRRRPVLRAGCRRAWPPPGSGPVSGARGTAAGGWAPAGVKGSGAAWTVAGVPGLGRRGRGAAWSGREHGRRRQESATGLPSAARESGRRPRLCETRRRAARGTDPRATEATAPGPAISGTGIRGVSGGRRESTVPGTESVRPSDPGCRPLLPRTRVSGVCGGAGRRTAPRAGSAGTKATAPGPARS